MRRPTRASRRLSKKVRREGGGAEGRQAGEGDGLRRGALRPDQLAPEALLPERVPPAVDRAPPLRVDLPLRGRGARDGRELLRVPAGHGRTLLRDVPGASGRGLPRPSSCGRARQRAEPPLAADRPSGERQPSEPSGCTSPNSILRRGGSKSSAAHSPTRSSRASNCFRRRSPRRSLRIGETPVACNDSPVSRGGWRPSMRWDINRLDQY